MMNLNLLRIAAHHSLARIALVMFMGTAALPGCVVYEPTPAPTPSTFDRAWSAALAAARDEGVRIVSEDRASGVIRGVRDTQDLTITMHSQADGSVRMEISVRGPKGVNPGLAGRISRAYDVRMGR